MKSGADGTVWRDTTATGTLDAADEAVSIPIEDRGAIGFLVVSSSLSGTLVAEVSVDGGTTWDSTQFVADDDGAVASSLVDPTGSKSYTMLHTAGKSNARVRCSARASGSAAVTVRATAAEGGGDSAAIAAAVADLDANTDQLEGYVDGLEANTADLDANTDQIEAKLDTLHSDVDGMEALATTLNAAIAATGASGGNPAAYEIGYHIAPYTEFTQDGAAFAEVIAGATVTTLNSWDTLANNDALYIVSPLPFNRVVVDVTNANGNAATLAAHYWDGDSWEAVTNLVDGTASGGATMAIDGNITFDLETDWATTTINARTGYILRLTVSAALDASVTASFAVINAVKLFSSGGSDIMRTISNEGGAAVAIVPVSAGVVGNGPANASSTRSTSTTLTQASSGRFVFEGQREIYSKTPVSHPRLTAELWAKVATDNNSAPAIVSAEAVA